MTSEATINSEHAGLKADLELCLRFESLLADLSAKLIHPLPGEVDRPIEDAQRSVCECFGMDRSSLWQWPLDASGITRLTHSYRSPRYRSNSDGADAPECFPWCQRQVLAGRIVAVPSVADLPAEAARDGEAWNRLGIQATLTIPLSTSGGSVFGCVSFHDLKTERRWSETLVRRLQLVARIFANALARQVADETQSESEARFRALAESALVGIYVLQNGSYTYVNPAMARVFGYSVAEMTGMVPLDIVQPSDHAKVRENIRRRIAGEVKTSQYQFLGRHKDGSTRHVEVYGTRLAINSHIALVGTLVDITERTRAETALRESVERFRQVATLAGEFIWEVDAEGLYTYASPSVERILGFTPAELVGKKHFYDLFEAPVREELKAAAFGVFADRQIFRNFPNPNIHKNGKIIHLETSGVPMVDAAGKLAGYRGADTDVTARRQAEAEAQHARLELAHMSRVSTLGELAASLAHELSQPLGAILRNTEAAELMLQSDSPDLEELRNIITDIRSDDQRANQVIDRLRSLLKRRSLALELIDINTMVAEVMSLVQADAAVRHVRLQHSAAPDLPKIRADRVHLQQVLLNLLLNAMEALVDIPPQNRNIRITSQQAMRDGVEIRVCDNGPGIPGESLKRLFEPFYTTKANGMGMGLPVSRTIIEVHRGRIWAENRTEGGACFCFVIPVAEKPQEASEF